MNQNDENWSEIFADYLPKIIRLAERNLESRYAAKFGAEDVAASVVRTVFGRIQKGTFTFDDDESLWKQLVTITLRRLSNKVRHENAAKRSINKTVNIDDDFIGSLSREPDPAQAIEFMDLLNRIGEQLDETGRSVLELRMAGYSYDDISVELDKADRTVGRKIQLIKELLEKEAEV